MASKEKLEPAAAAAERKVGDRDAALPFANLDDGDSLNGQPHACRDRVDLAKCRPRRLCVPLRVILNVALT